MRVVACVAALRADGGRVAGGQTGRADAARTDGLVVGVALAARAAAAAVRRGGWVCVGGRRTRRGCASCGKQLGRGLSWLVSGAYGGRRRWGLSSTEAGRSEIGGGRAAPRPATGGCG